MTIEEQEKRRDKDLWTTTVWLLRAWVVGLAFVALRFVIPWVGSLFAKGAPPPSGNATIALLWALAWFAAGFLMGFLFGIPKVLQRPAGLPAAAPSSDGGNGYRLHVNTNLEEISDWLTKILVGATLTQLGNVPRMVQSAAAFVATGIGGAGNVAMAGAIIVYFSTLGFFAGYVLTRLFFSEAFGRSDLGLGLPSREDSEALASAQFTPEDPPANPQAQQTAERMRAVPISDQLTATQALTVARGALLTEDNGRALEAARLAASKDASNPQAQVAFALALYRASAPSEAVIAQIERTRQTVLLSPPDAGIKEDIYNSLIFIALYQAAPAGPELAIKLGEEFLRSAQPARKSIWTNLACAYGQRYSWLKKQLQPDVAELKRMEDRVLNCIQQGVKLDPAAIDRFKQLAVDSGGDQDLVEVVKDSAAIRAALG